MKWHPSEISLQKYREKRLGAFYDTAIERHLQGCSRCRTQLRAYADLEKALAKVRAPLPPPHLADAVLNAVLATLNEEKVAAEKPSPKFSPKSLMLGMAPFFSILGMVLLASGLLGDYPWLLTIGEKSLWTGIALLNAAWTVAAALAHTLAPWRIPILAASMLMYIALSIYLSQKVVWKIGRV